MKKTVCRVEYDTDAAVLIKGNRDSRTERISHRLELKSHTTVLEVNLRAMERNINYFRSQLSPQTKMVAMVLIFRVRDGVFIKNTLKSLLRQGMHIIVFATRKDLKNPT